MISIPQEIQTIYGALLVQQNVPLQHHASYKKWLRYYWDFCHKHHFATKKAESLPAFIDKLRSKRQPEVLCEQARQAVLLYCTLDAGTIQSQKSTKAQVVPVVNTPDHNSHLPITEHEPYSFPINEELDNVKPAQHYSKNQALHSPGEIIDNVPSTNIAEPHMPDAAALKERGANWQGIYDGLVAEIKLRKYSPKTLTSYRAWVRKFQTFLKSKDSSLVTQQDVIDFLTHLAVDKKVAASTQNQAFNALLFLFRHVIKKDFGEIKGVPRAKRRPYVPVVLSRPEVDKVFAQLRDPFVLPTQLLYGCGLRISECLNLRLQDFNLDEKLLTVHNGKGKKDRVVPLPHSIMLEIQQQIEVVSALFDNDIAAGYAGVFLPDSLGEKFKNAGKDFSWQWFFPAKTLTFLSATKEYKRYHLHDTQLQKGIRAAVKRTRLLKRVSAHTFRHSFASHLLQANYDIRTIQALMGHSDVRTTMIYMQTVPSLTLKEAKSPLDF